MSNVKLNRASLSSAELEVYQGIAIANVSLVDSESRAREALEVLMSAEVIGFDTESKPTFLKGEISTGPHLVQLATDDRAYLFPISPAREITALKAILESPRLLKVGFGLGNDRSALKSRLGIDVANLLDLGAVLRGPDHKGTVGAKVAVAHFFGQRLQKSKKTGTSNWSNPRLTERQLLYAANDAHVALLVYRAWVRTREDRESPATDKS
ncbi:3'-5' exonuclease [Burkholderia sp. L27(2015)]|uniref:3'-5' exonuclease n=1 Tax=Burkholderia sp. L27(2015) TaxID=1641858 RepID=UPI00131CC194|nr:3'-5' exonuclease [Burkholderia sp. L27(2015)]